MDSKIKNVLKYLVQSDRGLTSAEAFTNLSDTRLSATIKDIKDRYKIDVLDRWEAKPNRYGKIVRYKRYYLDPKLQAKLRE